MLMRMYTMWAEKQGYKIRELNFQEGDVERENRYP
jgi:peptide chain release factor 2